MLIAAKSISQQYTHAVDNAAITAGSKNDVNPPALCGFAPDSMKASAWQTVATKTIISYVTCPHCRISLRNLKKGK